MLPASVNRLQDIPLLGNLAISHYLLANGLHVAIVVDRTTPIFTYQTWFRVGSADEAPGRQGLAHLFEHMMFRKTTTRGMGEFENIVNKNGGTGINAYTSRDQTVYFFTFPNDKLEIAVDLEADRMRNLAIDAEMFETEKGAVLTEKNRGLDEPGRMLWEEVYKLAYVSHPYRYSTIGEIESIRNFTVEEAVNFYKNHYSPNNALIIVVGDIDPDNAVAMIVEKYGSFQAARTKMRGTVQESPQLEERSMTITHPKATRRMLAKVWHIPNNLHPDYPALAAMGRLLTSGKSAILNERILNKSRATELFADAYISRDMGTFEFYVQPADGESYEAIENTFSQAASELAEGKISEEQIQIVKNNVLREMYQAATVPARLARLLGDGYVLSDDLTHQIRALQDVETVRVADVQRVAREYLLQGKPTTVRLEPRGER